MIPGAVAAADKDPGGGRRLPRILVIGYGNPGRRDDGLGPALAARVERFGWPGVTVESDYQLMIEHAVLVAGHDFVVFADAAADVPGDAAFYLRPVAPAAGGPGLSHHLSPPAVLQLAADCFETRPRAWVLGIRAVNLNAFGEGLTPGAQANLERAVGALKKVAASWRREWGRCVPSANRTRPRSAADRRRPPRTASRVK